MKQFYENKLQIFLESILICARLLIKIFFNITTFGNLLIKLGVFYIIFLYIILLFNMMNVRETEVNISLYESFFIFSYISKNIKVNYENIKELIKDGYYVKIILVEGNKQLFRMILISNNIHNKENEEVLLKLSEKIKKFKKYKVSI